MVFYQFQQDGNEEYQSKKKWNGSSREQWNSDEQEEIFAIIASSEIFAM